MPQVNIPDIGLVNFPDTMSHDDIVSAIQNNILKPKSEPAKPQATGPEVLPEDDTSSDFMRGISNTLPGIKSTYNAAKVLTGKALGNKEMMQRGVEGMQEAEAQQKVKHSDEFTEAWNKGIGTVLTDWLPYQIGSGVGNLAETAGFAALGAGVGAVTGLGVGAAPGALEGVISKTLIKKGIRDLAEKYVEEGAKDKAEQLIKNETKSALKSMGVQAGLAGQAVMHGAGETTGRALDELQQQGKTAEDLDLGRVLPAAAIHSIADFAAEKFLMQGAKGLNIKGLNVESTGKLFYDITKAIGTTGAKELLPEEIQTMAERYGASLSLTDAEALKDYINTAAASFAMSIVPGGMGGVKTFLTNPNETSKGNEAQGKDSFTGIDKNIEKQIDTLTPEEVAKLNPATDESGQSLGEAAPVIQNVVKPKTEEETQLEKNIALANEKLNKLEEGKALHPSTIKSLFDKFGIERPEGMTGLEATQLLREHLTKIGEQNVGGPDVTTSGASTTISSGVETNNNPVTVAGAQSEGVGTTNAPQIESGVGTEEQQPTLTETSKDTVAETKEQKPKLAGPPVRNEAFQTMNQAEYQAALEKAQTEVDQTEATRQEALQEVVGKNIPQTKTDEDIRDEYELARQALSTDEKPVPAWNNLSSDEKDYFLGSLKTSKSAQDFDNAIKELMEYKKNKNDNLESLPAQKQKIANQYDENKKIYSRQLGIEMPMWSDLSQEAKNIYFDNVKSNTAVEQDAGFNAVASQLEQEGKGIRGVSRAGVEQLKTQQTSEVAHTAAQERIAKEIADNAQAVGKGHPLSSATILALMAEDINSALTSLQGEIKGLVEGKLKTTGKGAKGTVIKDTESLQGTKLRNYVEEKNKLTSSVFRLIASTLNTLKFNSKVVLIDKNNEVIQRLEREGKLAEYDPKTDTFYFTEAGLDESTFLHEVVHAATVKLINKFLTDPASLTDTQRAAMEHMQTIFNFAQKRLANKFPNAFENLYEFVSYALTDFRFQDALANTQVRALAKFTAFAKNLWSQFTTSLSNLYGLVKPTATKLELHPELFAAFAGSLSPMDKESLYEEKSKEEGIDLFDVGDIESGREPELKLKKEKFTPKKSFLSTTPGYEGNLLLEVAHIFNNILEAPEAGIEVIPLAASSKGAAGKVKRAPEEKMHGKEGDLFENNKENDPYNLTSKQKPKKLSNITKYFTTTPGRRRLATIFQNRSYNAKALQDTMELAELTNWEDDNKINTPWTFITLANTRAKNLFSRYVATPRERLEKSIVKLSELMGTDTDAALKTIHRLLEALHEGERRAVKYILTVPLSDNKVLNNNTMSPADRRAEIIKLLDTKRLSKDQAKALRNELDNIVARYKSAVSNSLSKGQQGNQDLLDINHERYNVLGVDRNILASRVKAYKENENIKETLDTILANLKELNDVTTMLNKDANYWSDYVDNRVNFYGYENYAPFRGKGEFNKNSKVDEDLDFDSPRLGKDLQDVAYGFDGRFTVSDNPVLQTMSDAIRASTRAGRKGLTLSIKNLLAKGKYNNNGQGVIAGRIIDHINFDERDTDRLNKIPKDKTILHYNKDGSIDVLEINDKPMLDSLRRTYQQTSTLTEYANNVTSFFGQLHTRYNYNFAPLNYIRDTLTNAWAIGAELGPVASAKLIGQISAQVARGGLAKAARVSYLIEARKFGDLENYIKNDPLAKNMVEFLKEGGPTSYLEGVSLKSNWNALDKELGKSRIIKGKEQLDKFMDIYNNMFELSSRAAAYGLMKSNYMTQGMSESAAQIRAAAFAKNLANFEQVGEWGKAMGAFYMFFRPSATGAVRAIEAVAPAFRSVDKALQDAIGTVSGLAENKEAQETFRRNYMEKKRNAQKMVGVLIGMGMTAYAMAALAADDDDMGRNDVLNDNMDQWTRFARFPLPRWLSEDRTPVQIPWGFGLGAFAAAGAQFASVVSGSQSLKGALSNIFLGISLDSFVPIPVSRMNAVEDPLAFAVDSMMPSTVRPLVEFVMNKNGLGQSIYNDSNRKMGDAYIGGDKIPQVWKDLAVYMANETMGGIDMSPNTMYFFANSYADGITRVGELAYGMSLMAKGEKEFNAKTDVPLFGSFFGSKSSIDSRQFSKMENEIKEMQRVINEFKTNSAQMARFRAERPMDEMIVNYYNTAVNNRLNSLRQQANKYRESSAYDPATKSELLKINQYQQNLVKYQMMNMFEAYGMERPR